MKKFSMIFLLLSLLPAAWQPALAESAADFFASRLNNVIVDYNALKGTGYFPEKFLFIDLDNDGFEELVIADRDLVHQRAYTKVGDMARNINMSHALDSDTLTWQSLSDAFFMEVTPSRDITLRHHPVFAYDTKIKSNRFTVPGDVKWDDIIMRNTHYDRMVFKPHVGNVHFVEAKQQTYDSDGTEIDLGLCYTYALDDANVTKKMFRGYSDDYATPIIVPHEWLDDHTPLQYTRWLYNEPERHGTADARQIVERYYGPKYKVHDMKWLATCEANERSFYAVTFKPVDGHTAFAFVCLSEGMVVSVRNIWFDVDPNNPNLMDMGIELDDLTAFAPDIMVMATCEQGMELYVQWSSFEGVHYDIWREVEDQWISISSNYHYVMAY